MNGQGSHFFRRKAGYNFLSQLAVGIVYTQEPSRCGTHGSENHMEEADIGLLVAQI